MSDYLVRGMSMDGMVKMTAIRTTETAVSYTHLTLPTKA